MRVELRLEVDLTSWVSDEEELDPLYFGAEFGEEVEGDFGLSDVVALVSVGVVDVDLHVVRDETSVDYHVLAVPLGVFAAVLADCGGPL